jgi:NitT/TauT family transport system substrate-binding protein
MTILNRRDLLLGTAATLAGTVTFAGERAFAAVQNVSSAYGPALVFNIPNYVPVELGFAKEEGLDLKLILFDAGTQIRDTLAAGQSNFAMTDAVNALQMRNRGKATKLLLATDNVAFYGNFIIRKALYDQGITSLEKFIQWKRPDGAKPIVAITAIGGSIYTFGTYVFDNLGGADKVNWISAGGTSAMMGGLASGQFDLIPGTISMIADAEGKGWGKQIFDVTNRETYAKYVGGNIPGTSFFALEETVASNKDAVQAFVNANYRGMQWLKNASAEEIFAKFIGKYISDVSPEASRRDIEYMKKVWNYSGGIPEDQYKVGAKLWFRETTGIKPIEYKDAVAPEFLANAVKKYG